METKKLELLAIEDNPKHLSDLREVMGGRVEAGVVGRVDYATTLTEAYEHLGDRSYDGVLSDIFFPDLGGRCEEQNGQQVANYCLQSQIPFVLVTSTHHHGKRTDPVCQWIRGKGMNLVDAMVEVPKMDFASFKDSKAVVTYWRNREAKIRESEADSKNFRGGFTALAYLIEGIGDGSLAISDDGIRSTFQNDDVDFRVFGLEQSPEFREELYESDPTFRSAFDKYCQGLFL